MFVFRCATGEKWPNMMMELAFVDLDLVYEFYAYIYMIISNFINGIIMINLFLMVTLQQYDEFTGKKYNPIEKEVFDKYSIILITVFLAVMIISFATKYYLNYMTFSLF